MTASVSKEILYLMLPSLSSSFPAHTGIEYPEEHFLRLSSALVDIVKRYGGKPVRMELIIDTWNCITDVL